MTLNQLAERIHQITADHGFWAEDRNFGEMLALCHSELSEALEEHRNKKPSLYYSGGPWMEWLGTTVRRDETGCPVAEFQKTDVRLKPEGVAAELADCIIRCLDILHSLGVDIDQVVADKVAYNAGREHMHGKAY